MDEYSNLENLLLFINNTVGVNISVKDMCGLSICDPRLNALFSFYNPHKNIYCVTAKRSSDMNSKCVLWCLRLQQRLADKVHEPFCGCCYAGVTETVIPVYSTTGRAVAIILINARAEAENRFRAERICDTYECGEAYRDDVMKAYKKMCSERSFSLKELKDATGYIADSLIGFYEKYEVIISLPGIEQRLSVVNRLRHAGNAVISTVTDYIGKHFLEKMSIDKFASMFRCSSSYLSHNFKKVTGYSLSEYVLFYRLYYAAEKLLSTDESLVKIANDCCFCDESHFCREFRKRLGESPGAFRAKNKPLRDTEAES